MNKEIPGWAYIVPVLLVISFAVIGIWLGNIEHKKVKIFTQEALGTYPAVKLPYGNKGETCNGIVVSDECLDDTTLGKGTRKCSETITGDSDSIVEEVKRKCPLVEKPLEYPLKSEHFRIDRLTREWDGDRFRDGDYIYMLNKRSGAYAHPWMFEGDAELKEIYQLLKSKYE